MTADLGRHAVVLLRETRARLFRLASIPEPLFDRRVRQRALPPLWLRRHAGPPSAFESSAREAVDQLRALGLLREGLSVLDLGCGPGSMALALRSKLGERGTYVGVDVHGPSVDWCTETFRSDPRFRFHWLERADSPYSKRSTQRSIHSIGELGTFELVLAKSLATHLLPVELRRLLAGAARCLSGTGKLVLTAFLFAGAGEGVVPRFPLASPHGCVRWRRRSHPRAAVAYQLEFFRALLSHAGLRETRFVPGFYPGDSAVLAGQDTIVAQREAGAPGLTRSDGRRRRPGRGVRPG